METLPFHLRRCQIHVRTSPDGELQLKGFGPRAMHRFDLLLRMALCCKVRLDCLDKDRGESSDVTVGNIVSGSDAVRLILLEAGMSQGNLLLVVEPGLVIGAKTCVQNPLFEPKVTVRQVLGEWVAFG